MKHLKTPDCKVMAQDILTGMLELSHRIASSGKASLAESVRNRARLLADQVMEGSICGNTDEHALRLVQAISSGFELETQLHALIRMENDLGREAVEMLIALDRGLEEMVLHLEYLMNGGDDVLTSN